MSLEILELKKLVGEYIIFIDSDDYIEPEMLKEMYDRAKENNSDIVICDYYEVYENKKLKKKALQKFSNDINSNYILSNPSPWNKLIKAKVLKEKNIKFLENHIYEDLATLPIIGGYAQNIIYVEKPLYNYIIREGSTMRQKQYNSKLESIFVAINHLEKQWNDRGFLEKYEQELEFINIYHLLYAGTGRFLEYKEGKEKLNKIINIIKNNYPNWKKNKYYKQQNLKFKITCNIFYNKIFISFYCKLRKIIK